MTTKKRILVLFMTTLYFFVGLLAQEQQPLVEKVDINWWVVPFYALDKNEQAVTDLRDEELIFKINGKEVPFFKLMPLGVTRSEDVTAHEKVAASLMPEIPQFKSKVVFLLFDNLFTDYITMVKSKKMAQEIIAENPPDTRFVVLSLEPIAGLHYHLGPTNDRLTVARVIDKKIKGLRNKDRFHIEAKPQEDLGIYMRDPAGRFKKETIFSDSVFERYATDNYLQTFITSMAKFRSVFKVFFAESKVVYLFSSGISEDEIAIKVGDNRHTLTTLLNSVVDLARIISDNGALLFVINQSGSCISIRDKMIDQTLALNSNGQYIEGSKNKVREKINQISRAYYDLAFSFPKANHEDLKLSVTTTRPNVRIYTAHRLGNAKQFQDLEGVDREHLALNVIDEGAWSKSALSITHSKEQLLKDQGEVSIPIPQRLLDKEVELYLFARDEQLQITGLKVKKKSVYDKSPNCSVMIPSGEANSYHAVIIDWEAREALVFEALKKTSSAVFLPRQRYQP